MMPIMWFRIIFYSLIALTTALLVRRMVKRRRRERMQAEVSAKLDQATSAAQAAADGASGADASQPPVLPSELSAPTGPATWASRKLFGKLGYGRDPDELPRFGPGDVPTADTGDFLYGSLTPVLAEMLPDSAARKDQTRRELYGAGFYEPHAQMNLAASRYLLIAAPMVLLGAMLVFVPQRLELPVMVLMIALPLLGWSLPRLYLKGRAADRINEMERAMPDLLDILNMSVSQGLTVIESLKRIGHDLRYVYPALSQEIRILIQQAEIGSFEQALKNMAERIDSSVIASFTTLFLQTERMGTSVSEALVEYSDNMRENLKQRADEHANKAVFKLLFPTVLCLMPAVYIFLLGPAIIELNKFFNEGGMETMQMGQNAIADIFMNED